ncbi:ABC transporter substrate-binding protein [Ereboglobus luteus]|uniref:Aliphatic sulfonate ABC transporter substrate-binding protein n=1 Tax=Ereboglobus luteus TaxID=1796921 RepID=A0A2U8E7A0_9BACT|nr:ABC transporter substrate-binding protein [Ereboglobus luteus]AWI10726.1 aliphatic sulfonate ABC transporter substrate-binding protein [Ereboglobus luteus]
MKTKNTFLLLIAAPLLAVALLISGCGKKEADLTVLRVGYFPNITHAQGVIGRASTDDGKGWFEQRLGPGVKVHWYAYNAGPTAMEAMIAGSIDMTYVGPNPALNAYMRSRGDEIRVIAGAAYGGAALLVRPAANIKTPADFRGKKIATPQFANTQDIAARVWLKSQGFSVTQTGGDVSILPAANPDQLLLFQQGKIDAVWTIEPWVSRIEREAGGKPFIEQTDAITTILVASSGALKDKRALVEKFLQGHRELTAWINEHSAEAQTLVQRGISNTVKREIPLDLVQASWKRLHFTTDVKLAPFEELVTQTRELGFIKDDTQLDRFIDTSISK